MLRMKKILRLTLITGIIISMLSAATLTASASCPLTNLLFGGRFGNLNSLFGNSGNNTTITTNTNTNTGCPITNMFSGNNNGNSFGNLFSFFNRPTQTQPPQSGCSPQTGCPQQVTQPPQSQPPQSQPPQSQPPVVQNPPVQSANTYAEEVLRLVNEHRAANGRSALQLDATLSAAADVRAKEVLTRFSHTRPNGTSCFTVLREFNISYNVCGENIAKGFSDARSVVNAWMNSSGHRANILNPNYKFMGVGKSGSGWCQLFIG